MTEINLPDGWTVHEDTPTMLAVEHPVFGVIGAKAGAQGWKNIDVPGPHTAYVAGSKDRAAEWVEEVVAVIEERNEEAVAHFISPGARPGLLEGAIIGSMNPIRVYLVDSDTNAEFGFKDDDGVDRARAAKRAAKFIEAMEAT